MKQQFKGFLSGVVVTVLIFTLAIPAVAATAKQINALYSGISVTLDGAKIPLKDAKGNAVEPFIVDGTTYLPVRAVGEALGLSVSFDGATQTVKLTHGGAKEPSAAYGRKNPAPIGTAQTISVKSYSGDYSATISITETVRGDSAYEILKAANHVWNAPPPDGKEYIVAKVSGKAVSATGEKSVHFTAANFKIFDSKNSEYTDNTMIIAPTPEFNGDAYPGGSIEGYIAIMVNKDDIAPKAVYASNYDGSGGIWFSL